MAADGAARGRRDACRAAVLDFAGRRTRRSLSLFADRTTLADADAAAGALLPSPAEWLATTERAAAERVRPVSRWPVAAARRPSDAGAAPDRSEEPEDSFAECERDSGMSTDLPDLSEPPRRFTSAPLNAAATAAAFRQMLAGGEGRPAGAFSWSSPVLLRCSTADGPRLSRAAVANSSVVVAGGGMAV